MSDAHRLSERLESVQAQMQANSDALDAIEETVDAYRELARNWSVLQHKMKQKGYENAEDFKAVDRKLNRLERVVGNLEESQKPDTGEDTTLAEANPDSTHYLGEGHVIVVESDPLDDPDDEPESIPLDRDLRGGGHE